MLVSGIGGKHRQNDQSSALPFAWIRVLHSLTSQSMNNHYWTMCVLENAIRVRAQYPSVEDGVLSFAHDNETGLDGFRPMDDLFCRMAHGIFRFEVNVLPLGTLSDRDETALVALAPIFEDRVELRIFGGFRRTDYSDHEQLGFHVCRHRQGNADGVL